MDDHKNFAVSAVATAPSPATTGTSLVVTAGHGTRFPTPPFNATVWPAASQPTPANAEIVRVTGIATDTLTIDREEEGTAARTIVVGDQIAATITDKTLDDLAETSAAPTVISVGSSFSSTGVPTATLPGTHATDDILLLLLESANQAHVASMDGYEQIGPQNGIGAAAAAGTTKLSIFWKRDEGSEVAPTIPDTGDHTFGVMLAIRGCPTVGQPFHFLGNDFAFAAAGGAGSPSGKTVVDNCLVLDIFGQAIDSAAPGNSLDDTVFADAAIEFDGGTADGVGGGIFVASGTALTPQDYGSTGVAWGSSTVSVSSRIAFLPATVPTPLIIPRSPETQVFIGSPADLDDEWFKPDGAMRVYAQICDGGGSGSGGRSAATAAGGGGGGGGGYDEAWFDARVLSSPTAVHAGRGGASAAADGAGNAGVVSEFGKGDTTLPLTASHRVAGTAATAAATADGGNGGCGSGTGITSPAVATTRLAEGVTTDGVAYGTVGGRGGSGTTAPVGGSPAQWGGGGGESGGDTDAAITSVNNGYSHKGAGGGAGGRTNTNISGSGGGGGAAGVNSAQGDPGADSSHLPYGGSGGCGGGSSVAGGGAGGFPGGGGGGGGGVASGTGGRGGDGCVVVTSYF